MPDAAAAIHKNSPSNSWLVTAKERRWYAAYTCANHEKRVLDQLDRRSIESFLPVYGSIRRWKDRKVRLELPLFPGYIFIRLALCDQLRILEVPSVVRLVGFGGKALELPAAEIENLRAAMGRHARIEPYPYLCAGRRVCVTSGPLAGLTGIVIRRKGMSRLVLSVDQILRSAIAEIDATDVEPAAANSDTPRNLSAADLISSVHDLAPQS